MKIKQKIDDNEKIKKIKEYKESFKTIWDDPKIGSAIKLSLWLIAVIILSLLIRIKGTQQNIKEPTQIQTIEEKPTKENILKQLKKITNYESNITFIKEQEEKMNITKTQEQTLIRYNGETIYLETNNEIAENPLINQILNFNINKIYDSIKEKEENYITIYKDNSYMINYTIPLNSLTEYELEETIDLTISGKENIEKIQINMENTNYNIKEIIQEITNINNIEEINMEVN